METNIALRPTYWASVSGGKDSLYMLNLILHNLDKYPLDGVVHFELEIDYPFIHDVIDYMEKECENHGIPFVRIKPRTSYYDLLEKYGFPTRIARWCNGRYKLDAEKQIRQFLSSKGFDLISYIGYCADETRRYGHRTTTRERYPLVEEGINEGVILEWAKNIPVFNHYYEYNRRCGCMFCPMASMQDSAYLKVFYPDKYEYLMKIARETELAIEAETGKPFSVWHGNAKYNTIYRDKRVRDVYAPRLQAQEAQRAC